MILNEPSNPVWAPLWWPHHARGLHGWMDGRTGGRQSGGRHGRKAASADQLRVGINSSGGDGQAKIAMSRQGRGTRTDGRTDRLVQAILPQSGVMACHH